MLNNFEIVREKASSIIIGEDGNWRCSSDDYKCFLKNETNSIISGQYQCMVYLGNDHFAVCNVIADVKYLIDGYSAIERYYDIVQHDYEINKPKLKWGVIRINRNEQGDIIPCAEVMIIPYLYDRISTNNLKTATAYNNGKLTYLDIDRESENYGKQLVPCILEHAVPFSTQYEGFAECSINGKVGYLPRACKARECINSSDLIKEKQTSILSKYLNCDESYILDEEAIFAYFNLTGIRLEKNNSHILRKKKVK